ncbi:hypothetical protein MAR_013476 [Mya arenaria]|uniref:Uncharacterized protein n=1 Tax=Mya arenaria TaxID=6604 RepID=A0ABY7G012_MYAAR|nr:hypothetical protein MAR_013476 [Mya arenaria]
MKESTIETQCVIYFGRDQAKISEILNMYWTVLGIAFVGAVLTTSEGCVTSQNVLSVNNSVSELTAGMAAIIANPPSDTVVMNIEEKVRACPELVAVTSLSTLDSILGGLSFTTLFENFATYDGFCDCFPGVLAAKALNEKAAQAPNGLVLNRPDGAYSTLVNLPVVCAL